MKGYRTVLFNALTIAAAAAAALDLTTLPPEFAPWVVAGIGVINVALRFLTTTPVGVK